MGHGSEDGGMYREGYERWRTGGDEYVPVIICGEYECGEDKYCALSMPCAWYVSSESTPVNYRVSAP